MTAEYILVPGVETWEATGDPMIWVWTMDARTKTYIKTRVGGGDGSSRYLRISIDDRRYNEQMIVEEMASSNPFRNGALKLLRTDGTPEDYVSDVDVTYHLTPDQLLSYFDVKEPDIFRESVTEITSELILRRMQAAGVAAATQEQAAILDELITTRYLASKSQRTYREEEAARARTNLPT